MKPLLIRCRLLNGYTSKDPWSPAIDGIVGASFMRERLGDEQYALTSVDKSKLTPCEGLPFEVVERDGHRWYAASSPRPVGEVGQERRHYHRRFDDGHERFLVEGVRKVMTAAGPFKSSRLFDTRRICRGVEWHAIGDPVEIRRLLGKIDQVGGRRGVGYGEVVEWIVEEGGDAWRARFERPIPASVAETEHILGIRMLRSLMPPTGVLPIECIVPDMSARRPEIDWFAAGAAL